MIAAQATKLVPGQQPLKASAKVQAVLQKSEESQAKVKLNDSMRIQLSRMIKLRNQSDESDSLSE
jgi:hypothetical protein